MVVTPSPFEWFARQELASLRLQRRFVIGVLLSLIIHALLLMFLPSRTLEDTSQADSSAGKPDGGEITVQLNPAKSLLPKAPADTAASPPRATPTPPTRPPKVAPPRVLAAPRSENPPFRVPIAPDTPLPPVATAPPPPVQTPPPTPATDQPPTDMASLVAQARARRGESESKVAAENANARGREQFGNNGAAALARNLQSVSRGNGDTGGVFQILEKGTRRAQFAFRGWANDTRGSWKEVIEVDAGLGGDVDRAIVRRMIELIRGYYKGDFKWESHRLGRVVTLSARVADNDGLEAFMMREFF
jgi:hypothetical protein